MDAGNIEIRSIDKAEISAKLKEGRCAMGQSYDIFISYRRDGGETLACLLTDRLRQLGYTVFYDVESLRSGMFNEKLYEVIENCKDVIIVLPEKALDRCVNEDDWVRREIAHSIQYRKNIVPVMMRNFEWPESLPGELQSLPNYNGLTANMEYFEATFDKLLKLLSSAVDRSFIDKEYYLVYNSFSPFLKKRRITSKIVVDGAAHAVMYSNVKNGDISTSDYQYYGIVTEPDRNIYLRLDNDSSSEKLDIVLSKGAGNFDRYIGILSGLSSAMLPVCFKCVCVRAEDIEKINNEILNLVLEHSNKEWNGNLLAIESFQINMFFSDAFLCPEE